MTTDQVIRPGSYGTEAVPAAQGPAGAPAALPLPPLKPLDPKDPVDNLAMQLLKDQPIPDAEDAARKVLGEARKQASEWLQLTPAERWLRNIKAAKLTEEEATHIQREILRNGYWEKDYSLYNGALKIKLRSRDLDANYLVGNAMDESRTGDLLVVENSKVRVQFAYSLSEYNGIKMAFANLEDEPMVHRQAYNKRLNFCARIPGPAWTALYDALRDFDGRVFAAMSEGSPAAF